MARYKDINYGAIGSSAPMQYWNDLMQASTALMLEQSVRWAALFQECMLGEGTPNDYFQAVNRLYAGNIQDAFVLSSFPWMWWGRFMGDVPSICFIIDSVTEATPEQTVMTPINVPRGSEVKVTELTRIGSAPKEVVIPSGHVKSQITNGGNALAISLQNTKQLLPLLPGGMYAGLVYSSDMGTTSGNRPLAFLNVYMQGWVPPASP
jgi:hypothetical protein